MFHHVFNTSRTFASVMIRRCISQEPTKGNVNHYTPNIMEKRFLVWTGKYKSLEEIPNLVSAEVMERCRNKVRIRLANIMMLLTIVGCGIMVYSGKEAAKRGETVSQQNIDWHKQYNEQQAKLQKNE